MLHVPDAALLERPRQFQRLLFSLPYQRELLQILLRRHPLQQSSHEEPQRREDRRRRQTGELGVLSLAAEHVDDASLRHRHSHRVQTLHYDSRELSVATLQLLAVLHAALAEKTVSRQDVCRRHAANEHVTAQLRRLGRVTQVVF